jgi:hypothetical protein
MSSAENIELLNAVSDDALAAAVSKPREVTVRVFHCFMIKQLKEEADRVFIIGTFVQRQLGLLTNQFFKYRFNGALERPIS